MGSVCASVTCAPLTVSYLNLWILFDAELPLRLIGQLSLILDTTGALLGATAAGFHGLEHTEDRAFRWTTGEARIHVPIDPDAPPAALAVDVVMTGQPKWLRIEADGCVLFDDTISSRWAESFMLDSCRLTPPSLEILLASDTHVPDTSDNRTLGVGVAAVELTTNRRRRTKRAQNCMKVLHRTMRNGRYPPSLFRRARVRHVALHDERVYCSRRRIEFVRTETGDRATLTGTKRPECRIIDECV